MSLARLIYYCAVVGGWAAFAGWLVAEILFFRHGSGGGTLEVALVSGLVGAAIGSGLSFVTRLSNAELKASLLGVAPGLVGGALGGALGGLIGDELFRFGLPRAAGWMIVGLGIGVADGLYERSPSKIRNGLIGGSLGGLVGGFLFDPIQSLVASSTGMSSRATAFVILGICIGALIGLAQVVLKDAWLTVLDGYRSGRQLILSQPTTVLGRAEHSPLPFIGPYNVELELEHLRISRQSTGSYLIEDTGTRLGTLLNNQPLKAPAVLRDGDLIKLASNIVRFNERQRSRSAAATAPAAVTTVAPPRVAPPPPVKKSVGVAAAAVGITTPPPGPVPAPAAAASKPAVAAFKPAAAAPKPAAAAAPAVQAVTTVKPLATPPKPAMPLPPLPPQPPPKTPN